MAKVAREADERPRLDDDSFCCVLAALGYCATLADCSRLSTVFRPVATSLMREARKEAVEASGGLFRDIHERRVNRFEEDKMDSWWTKWTVEKNESNDARCVYMRESQLFVGGHLPTASIRALAPYLPVHQDDVRGSVDAVATRSFVPADLRSLDFRFAKIGAKLRTRDPGLQLFVGGVLQAGLPEAVEIFDEAMGRPFVGDFGCHAFFVRWSLCAILPVG